MCLIYAVCTMRFLAVCWSSKFFHTDVNITKPQVAFFIHHLMMSAVATGPEIGFAHCYSSGAFCTVRCNMVVRYFPLETGLGHLCRDGALFASTPKNVPIDSETVGLLDSVR